MYTNCSSILGGFSTAARRTKRDEEGTKRDEEGTKENAEGTKRKPRTRATSDPNRPGLTGGTKRGGRDGNRES